MFWNLIELLTKCLTLNFGGNGCSEEQEDESPRCFREIQTEAKRFRLQREVEQTKKGERQMIAEDNEGANTYINLDFLFRKPIKEIYQSESPESYDTTTHVIYTDDTSVEFEIDTNSHDDLCELAEKEQIRWREMLKPTTTLE